MKLVILAGGLGTRLREETEFRPKPMVEVGGRPILWHLMKYFASYGIDDFVVCAGYRKEVIQQYFMNLRFHAPDFTIDYRSGDLQLHSGAPDPWRVTVVDTGAETMTGGRIQRIRHHITDDRFMVTYGDGLADVDLDKLIAHHDASGLLATVTAVRPPTRFGLLRMGANDQVTRFMEKPVSDSYVNGGFFVFERQVFDYLSGDDCVLEQGPLEALTRDGQLDAFRHEGFWQPMDTYREFEILNGIWSAGNAPWKRWED